MLWECCMLEACTKIKLSEWFLEVMRLQTESVYQHALQKSVEEPIGLS